VPFKKPSDPGPVIQGYDDWWYPGKTDIPPAARPPDIILRGAGSATFQLVRGFGYVRPSACKGIDVPAHQLTEPPTDRNNSTDFASVPSLFWWLIASYGHQTRAALIHDHLWEKKDDRVETNEIFRDALAESDVAFVRRWIMWAAVDAVRRLGAGALSMLGALLEVVTVFAFLISAALWVQPWIWDGFAQLWSLVTWLADQAPSPLKDLWQHWLSRIPFGDGYFTLAIAAAGILAWQHRWLLAAFGLALVLPPLIPELISRRLLLWSEWPFYWVEKRRPGRKPGMPTPKPTMLPTRAFLRL
jgi:Protein of unknown function (DUF1353)